MSAVGPKPTAPINKPMSAQARKADISGITANVCDGPQRDKLIDRQQAQNPRPTIDNISQAGFTIAPNPAGLDQRLKHPLSTLCIL
jgi:hypothetical protein